MNTDGSAAGEWVTIHRLSDLDEWEFYRVTPPERGAAGFMIGLRPYAELQQVEYEVWDVDGEEPRGSGSVACEDAGALWSKAAREPIVGRIVLGLGSEG